MFDNKIASVERHERFLTRVKQSGEVWGFKGDEGWCITDSNDNEEMRVMPFWSDRAYAQQCARDEWEKYNPTTIDLVPFTTIWLPGLAKDNLLVGTNWNAHLIGEEIEPLLLKRKLEDEVL